MKALQDAIELELRKYSCYDLLPVSMKVVVLDAQLQLQKGLAVILQHGFHSVPLWNAEKESFAGMLTTTDVIRLVLYLNKTASSYDAALSELDEMSISRLKDLHFKQTAPEFPVFIHPSVSLYEASQTFLKSGLHRLPLVDDKRPASQMILTVLSSSKILRFITVNCPRHPDMDRSIQELALGKSANQVETVNERTSLQHVLELFIDRRLSAVPILDGEGKVLDVFEKYDVLDIARQGTYFDMTMSLGTALSFRSASSSLHTCSKTDTLSQLLDTIKQIPVRRFIIVSETGTFEGLISLHDILSFLMRPAKSRTVPPSFEKHEESFKMHASI